MSYLKVLRLVLAGRRPGSKVTADAIRFELDAAQVPPSQYGGLFAEACAKGDLEWTGETVRSTHRPAKGRRIQTYRVLPRRRTKITKDTP